MVLSRLSCLAQEVVEPPRNFDISGRFWAPGAPRDPPGGPPTPPENFEKIKIVLFFFRKKMQLFLNLKL